MLLFLEERNCWFPQNMSKLNEQESTFADHITENSPEEISISVAEREVQVQMEDGLGEVQSRWDLYSDCNRTACYSGRVSGYWRIISLLQYMVWLFDTESYPIRLLTARQERTEVVTRAGLVFSIHDREGVFLLYGNFFVMNVPLKQKRSVRRRLRCMCICLLCSVKKNYNNSKGNLIFRCPVSPVEPPVSIG